MAAYSKLACISLTCSAALKQALTNSCSVSSPLLKACNHLSPSLRIGLRSSSSILFFCRSMTESFSAAFRSAISARLKAASISFFAILNAYVGRFAKRPYSKQTSGRTENGAPRCVCGDMLFYSYLNRKNCGRPVIVYLFLQHRPYAVQYGLNVP